MAGSPVPEQRDNEDGETPQKSAAVTMPLAVPGQIRRTLGTDAGAAELRGARGDAERISLVTLRVWGVDYSGSPVFSLLGSEEFFAEVGTQASGDLLSIMMSYLQENRPE